MVPLLPEEETPVLRSINPLLPEVPLAAVLKVKEPLLEASLKPETTLMLPPVFPGAVVAPLEITI